MIRKYENRTVRSSCWVQTTVRARMSSSGVFLTSDLNTFFCFRIVRLRLEAENDTR